MEKLVEIDEVTRLIGLLGDVIDGLESSQARHADPFIEIQLPDTRYVRDRLAKLLIE